LKDLNKDTLKEIIKIYLSLDKRNLSSNNLLEDFDISKADSVSKKLSLVLYKSLQNPNERTFMLHSEWERLFKLA
jgi:intein-encoded DNA endonuclease-like protein